jgi:hypothetical protein
VDSSVRAIPEFEEAWNAVAKRRHWKLPSPRLRPLLGKVYFCLNSESVDLRSLKESLLELLEFLAGEGRTSANGWAVDRFFAESEGW